MPGVIVDIGTGDGSFVYELAKKYPDRMIIGIDPNQKGLIDVSRKTIKKSAKGGVKNALFVLANVSDLPDDLENTANQVFINFPWGDLLTGLVLGEEKIWKNIRKICVDSAVIDLITGYNKSLEVKEVVGSLPVLDENYFRKILVPKLEPLGFKLEKILQLDSGLLKNYPSKWAKN